MDKEDVVYMYTMKYYLAIRKDEYLPSIHDVDGTERYYAGENKSLRER